MTFRGATTANDGSTTSSSTAVMTLPSGSAAGDACAVTTVNNWANPTASMPAGWTVLSGPDDKTSGSRAYLWGKVLDAGDITAGAVTVTWSASTRCVGSCAVFKDVSSSPFGTALHADGTSGGPLSMPSGTAASTSDFVMFFVGSDPTIVPDIAFPSPATTDAQASLNESSGTNTHAGAGHYRGTSYAGGAMPSVADMAVQQGYLVPIESTTAAPPPTVSAGTDQSDLEPGATVTLTGTVETGTAASVAWRQISGPTVTLSSTITLAPTYMAPPNLAGATLVFGFTATDASSNVSDEATVTHAVLYSTQRVIRSGVQVPLLVNVNRT